MTMMPPPEREVLEREIKLTYFSDDGDISTIARFAQMDQSYISKMMNPAVADRKSWVYTFILFLWICDCMRLGLADDILKIVHRERDKWTGGQTRVFTNPADTTSNIGVQFCEFLASEMSGKSFDAQMKELVDIEQAVNVKKEELISGRNVRHFGGRVAS